MDGLITEQSQSLEKCIAERINGVLHVSCSLAVIRVVLRTVD